MSITNVNTVGLYIIIYKLLNIMITGITLGNIWFISLGRVFFVGFALHQSIPKYG